MTNLKTIAIHDLPDYLDLCTLGSLISDLEIELENCDNVQEESDIGHDIKVLNDFQEEIDSYLGNGDSLIREGEFTDYARELVQDTTPELRDIPPFITSAIDWEQVANEVKMDYSEFELSGVTYYGR